MKESLAKVDRKLIFRETFTDEQSVRANGGVPSGVIFNKGIALLTGSSTRLVFPSIRTSEFSFRIKFKLLTVKAQSFLCGIFTVGNYEWIGVGSTGSNKITISNKANAFTSSLTSLTANKWYDVIITANSTSTKIYIDGVLDQTGVAFVGKTTFNQMSYIPGQSGFDMNTNVELLEFYEGTLTPQEVLNLYQNKRYKKLAPHGEILGPELITNGNFDSSLGWNVPTGWDVSGGKANYLDTVNEVKIWRNDFVMKASTIHKLSFTISNASSFARLYILNYSGSYAYFAQNYWLIEYNNGTYNITFTTPTGTNERTGISFYGYTSGSAFSIDNVSLKEYVSKAELIMDIDAFDGVIKNRLSGGLLPNIISNLADSTFTSDTGYWTKTAQIAIANGVCNLKSNDGSQQYIYKTLILTTGKQYRLTYNVIRNGEGLIQLTDGNTVFTISNSIGTNTYIFTATFSSIRFRTNGVTDIDIDNIVLQEVIPSVVNTAVTVVNDGGVKAMRFNGTSSKLNCGLYNNLLGDITMCAWVKFYGLGGSTYGNIIDSTKTRMLIQGGGLKILVSSDGSISAASATNSIVLNKWTNIIATRKSDGKTSIYINSILSSTANQTSGTPVAATTNITIGNNNVGTQTHDGNIAQVQIYNGILSQEEISQKFTSERSKYNV